jgi:L-fucose mutarotase
MLRGLDPLLTAELLHALRSAGHGDEIVVVDCNFPATSVAAHSFHKEPILIAGATADQVVQAICSVLPLDFFVPWQIQHMCPDEGNDKMPALGKEGVAACVQAAEKHYASLGVKLVVEPVKRSDFYGRAKTGFVIVQAVSERRPYTNVILKKGVIGPDGTDLLPPK